MTRNGPKSDTNGQKSTKTAEDRPKIMFPILRPILEQGFSLIHQHTDHNVDVNGKPIYSEKGKVLKGPNYFKPNLSKFLK